MNGAQDLGGMMGFGPVLEEADEPLFHAGWERRALGLTLAAGACGQWNIDISRHARETLHPLDYLTSSYYEIWIKALEKLLLASGMVYAEEIGTGVMSRPGLAGVTVLKAQDVAGVLAKGSPYQRCVPQAARFTVGDGVRCKVMTPATHTRLPRYARGKAGIVEAVRGAFVFPDSHAHGQGEAPQWCYTLRFSATELWGVGADAAASVMIDAFDSYLEPA